MAQHTCTRKKDIDGLMDYRIVTVEAISGIKTNQKFIMAILLLVLAGVVFPIYTQRMEKIQTAKNAEQDRIYREAQYYKQRDWIDPDEYAIDDDNHSAEFGTLDF